MKRCRFDVAIKPQSLSRSSGFRGASLSLSLSHFNGGFIQMDSSTSQRRAQSGSVLLRRPGLHHQRLHSSLGRAPIWPSQTRSHAKPEVPPLSLDFSCHTFHKQKQITCAQISLHNLCLVSV